MRIKAIKARQILDSRGNPTVEADVILDNDVLGRASVPSGASTGVNEALELRDGDSSKFGGKSVYKAIDNIKGEITQRLLSLESINQHEIDEALITLDGTPNKARLGANAILAVSLATAKALSRAENKPFYQYIKEVSGRMHPYTLPMPLMNLINGGMHANFASDIQEFVIMPLGAQTFSQAVQIGSEIFHTLGKLLKEKGYQTTVGDEGGYAPIFKNGNFEALEFLSTAITKSGYKVGKDVTLGLDIAASAFYNNGIYQLKADKKKFDTSQMIDWIKELVTTYSITSVEDGISESDWEGWTELTRQLGDKIQLVGDDLLVTNSIFLQKAIEQKAGNAILIKLNQIGTLTETIKTVLMAQDAGWKTIISHRSGETEDVSISHLAVGLATGQIKTGSVARSERTAKYNELLRIEEELGDEASLAHV